MQNHILYQAFNNPDVVNECRYSLLKYLAVYNLKPPAHTGIVIYTDQPALFEEFESYFSQFEMLPVEKLKAGTTDNSCSENSDKISLLKCFFNSYQGNVLYFDTNTYIVEPVEDIFTEIESGVCYLYEKIPEQKKEDSIYNKVIELMRKKVQFPTGKELFSSKVVGINSDKIKLLEDAKSMIGTLQKQSVNQDPESYALSYSLQQQANIKTANHRVAHYSDLKEFRDLLKKFFTRNGEESIPNLIKLIHPFDAGEIQKQKHQYETQPLYKKLMDSVTGNKWSIQQYQKKI